MPWPLVLRACSHVVCKTCCDTLVRPSHQCSVCDTVLKDKEIVDMDREGRSQLALRCFVSFFFLSDVAFLGTGYSGGGRAETVKVGVAFQG